MASDKGDLGQQVEKFDFYFGKNKKYKLNIAICSDLSEQVAFNFYNT